MAVQLKSLLLPAAIVSAFVCQAQPCEVTLTSASPMVKCTLPQALLAKPPVLVEIPVRKIVNPSAQSFSIYVYLGHSKVGNVTVYPPDQTGVFMMRWRPPHNARSEKQISVEIRRSIETQPWQNISVTIGPLRWIYEEPK